MSDHEMEVDEVEESVTIIQSRVFNEEKLPSSMDVLSRISLAYADTLADDNKSEQLEFFTPIITQELLAIWERTSISILTEKGVFFPHILTSNITTHVQMVASISLMSLRIHHVIYHLTYSK